MASQLDAADKQQTLDWAAARQAWDQHVEALDTDAGERADGVTALESKLGTRAHWDGVYERELRNFAHDPSDEGVDWFSDDVGDRLMEYVTENCPLEDGVLDLGCGSAVFLLDLAANREGRFLGIDYSEVAVALAANVGRKRGLSQVRFCHADATRLEDLGERFGLVLDKGTFDAYMLGAAASVDRYAASVRAALKPGGVFVITTCNSTADEVAALFTARGFVERRGRSFAATGASPLTSAARPPAGAGSASPVSTASPLPARGRGICTTRGTARCPRMADTRRCSARRLARRRCRRPRPRAAASAPGKSRARRPCEPSWPD